MKWSILIVFSFVFLSGCGATRHRYLITTPAYEDQYIKADFTVGERVIGLQIRNKTKALILINWDLVSLVGPWEQTYRVIHKGVKFTDRGAPQAPSVIPPGYLLNDIATPAENIVWKGDRWIMSKMLPDPNGFKLLHHGSEKYDQYKEYVLSLYGKHFKLFMPLTWGNQDKLYEFDFIIVGVDPPIVAPKKAERKRQLFGGEK